MAPSEAAVEIRDIFDEIISNNLRYCALCLRTENERRLVEPKSFMKCLSVMRLGVPVVNTICFVCEAAATRAVTLFQAISFSCIINRWFKDMATKLKYKDEMPNHLDRYVESDSARAVSALPGLEAAPLPQTWSQVRGYHDLVQTEMLVINDLPPMADGDMVEIIPGPPATPTPPPPPDPIEEPVDNVITIEDDEEQLQEGEYLVEPCEDAVQMLVPLDQLSEHPGSAAYMSDEVQVLSSDKGGCNIILHPMGAAGSGLYMPSLDGQLGGGQLLAGQIVGGQYVGEQLVGGQLVGGQFVGGQLMGGQIVGGQQQLYGGDTPQNHSRVTITSIEVLNQDELVPRGDGSEPPPPSQGCARAEHARPLRGGRVDWEDKIPMDVISFVDATDPLAPRLPAPRKRPLPTAQ